MCWHSQGIKGLVPIMLLIQIRGPCKSNTPNSEMRVNTNVKLTLSPRSAFQFFSLWKVSYIHTILHIYHDQLHFLNSDQKVRNSHYFFPQTDSVREGIDPSKNTNSMMYCNVSFAYCYLKLWGINHFTMHFYVITNSWMNECTNGCIRKPYNFPFLCVIVVFWNTTRFLHFSML